MGFADEVVQQKCDYCGGGGRVNSADSPIARSIVCPQCKGSGMVGTKATSLVDEASFGDEFTAAFNAAFPSAFTAAFNAAFPTAFNNVYGALTPVTLNHRLSVAVSANGRNYGYIDVNGNRYGLYVPSGRVLVLYFASGSIELVTSGTITYRFQLIAVIDGGAGASEIVLYDESGIPNSTVDPIGAPYWQGGVRANYDAPLATIVGPARVGIGFRNHVDSTGASADGPHIFTAAGFLA